MAEVAEKPKSIRERLGEVQDKLIADGRIQPNAESAARAAAVPAFSEGTVALDENTGKPIAPKPKTPSFSDGGTTAPDLDRNAATIGAPGPAATHEREAPRAAAPAAEAPKPVAQEAGAQAAEAAAQAVAEEIEFDEFEFEDPDLGAKFPVRVPKQYKEIAKRGYGRRAAHDRALTFLKEADPSLRPLIENGQLRQILPLLQRALSDQAYGEYVWNGYQRAQQGLPLIEQARQEAAAAGIQAPAPQVAPEYDFSQEDPFFAERIKPLQQQFAQRYESLEQKLSRLEQERAEQQQRQVNEQRTNEQRAQEMQQAHQDLGRAYPHLFHPELGPNDPSWSRAIQQAKDAGYTDVYGLRAGIVFGGQLVQQMEAERLAATASPAAAMLAQQDGRLTELARQQAAAASRSVGGGGAPMQAPARKPLPKPATRRPDGSLKSKEEFLNDQLAYIASTQPR